MAINLKGIEMTKYFYSKLTSGFYVSDVHDVMPDDVIEITDVQHNELLNALNSGCIIFDDLTYSEPKPSLFHEWDGFEWVFNYKLETSHKRTENEALKVGFLKQVNEKIAYLQDAVDLEIATSEELEQLKVWKNYRVLLNRIDVNDVDVVFPEQPSID